MKEYDGKQANEIPRKLAQALLTLASADDPPLRFTVGTDAVQAFEERLASKRADS